MMLQVGGFLRTKISLLETRVRCPFYYNLVTRVDGVRTHNMRLNPQVKPS